MDLKSFHIGFFVIYNILRIFWYVLSFVPLRVLFHIVSFSVEGDFCNIFPNFSDVTECNCQVKVPRPSSPPPKSDVSSLFSERNVVEQVAVHWLNWFWSFVNSSLINCSLIKYKIVIDLPPFGLNRLTFTLIYELTENPYHILIWFYAAWSKL